MYSKIVIGRWGNIATLIIDTEKRVKILSEKEVFEDQFGNPCLSEHINKFVKINKVSTFQDGYWVYIVRTQKQLKEFSRKLEKLGYMFEPNLNLKKFFNHKEARDITATDISLEDLPLPIQ